MSREKVWIPYVPAETVKRRLKRVKPVMYYKRGGTYYLDIEGVDIDTDYLKDPKRSRKAVNIQTLDDITTYHQRGDGRNLQATLRDIISQIPTHYINKTIAFEIIQGREVEHENLFQFEAIRAGYDVAITRLYCAFAACRPGH